MLVAGTTEGKEIAGRLAVKTGSGVLTDAVNVTAGEDGAPVAEQPNFGGSITVHSVVRKGTPIIAVRPNAITPEASPGAGRGRGGGVRGVGRGQGGDGHRAGGGGQGRAARS